MLEGAPGLPWAPYQPYTSRRYPTPGNERPGSSDMHQRSVLPKDGGLLDLELSEDPHLLDVVHGVCYCTSVRRERRRQRRRVVVRGVRRPPGRAFARTGGPSSRAPRSAHLRRRTRSNTVVRCVERSRPRAPGGLCGEGTRRGAAGEGPGAPRKARPRRGTARSAPVRRAARAAEMRDPSRPRATAPASQFQRAPPAAPATGPRRCRSVSQRLVLADVRLRSPSGSGNGRRTPHSLPCRDRGDRRGTTRSRRGSEGAIACRTSNTTPGAAISTRKGVVRNALRIASGGGRAATSPTARI